MKIVNPSIADILFTQNNIVHNQLGIDTIRLTPNYKTFIKTIEKMGLEAVKPSKGSPVSRTIEAIEKDI